MLNAQRNKSTPFWNRFAIFYDYFMRRTYEIQYKEILHLIEGELGKNQEVLEIGAGTGEIAINISAKVHKVTASDLSSPMLRLAKEKAGKEQIPNIFFTVQDACALDFPDSSFDVIIACNILHVIPEPQKVLAGVRRVLKPDGVFITATYCHGHNISSNLISRLMSIVGFRAYSRWSADSLQSFLKAHGFRVVKNTLLGDRLPLLYLVCHKSEQEP